MEAIRIEATVQPNGRVILNDLPFEEGKQVEIIVLDNNGKETIPFADTIASTLNLPSAQH